MKRTLPGSWGGALRSSRCWFKPLLRLMATLQKSHPPLSHPRFPLESKFENQQEGYSSGVGNIEEALTDNTETTISLASMHGICAVFVIPKCRNNNIMSRISMKTSLGLFPRKFARSGRQTRDYPIVWQLDGTSLASTSRLESFPSKGEEGSRVSF